MYEIQYIPLDACLGPALSHFVNQRVIEALDVERRLTHMEELLNWVTGFRPKVMA
jgi:hypothetical protein